MHKTIYAHIVSLLGNQLLHKPVTSSTTTGNNIKDVRFKVLTATSMKMAVF
jgi:hypothetical protein